MIAARTQDGCPDCGAIFYCHASMTVVLCPACGVKVFRAMAHGLTCPNVNTAGATVQPQ